MDIAALSMDLSSVNLDQQATGGILKMAMDLPKVSTDMIISEMQDLRKEMESLVMSHLGQYIDVYA